MSKKFVSVAIAIGCLACAASSGCCHRGACGFGGCAGGSCGHAYPGPEYAGADGDYEEYAEEGATSQPSAVTAAKPRSGCKNGSCPY